MNLILDFLLYSNRRGRVAVIPFETHGKIDLMQAASAAALPWLLGFGHKSQALPHLQALNEVGVVDLTDWESGIEAREERWRKASQAGN